MNLFTSDQMKNDYRRFKGNYEKEYKSLKARTVNLLKILKSSQIPFLLCYFPKIGGEFPYDLFAGKPIELKKEKIGDDSFKYKFVLVDKKNYLSTEELSQNYLTKEEISKNYITKEEMSQNYLSKEEFKKMEKMERDLAEELADAKEKFNLLLQAYPGLKEILDSKNYSNYNK